MAGLLSWIGRSVDDLVKMGYPESVAKRISSGELPMDYASRMERARQLGYDVANPEYRGGGLTQIESPEALFDKGLFSTNNPSLAATYANARNGGNTMPVLLNRENTTTINADGTRWNDINNSGRSTNDYVARVKNYDLPSIQFKDVRDIGPRTVGYPREVLQNAFEPSNVTATLDPTMVRSQLSAAFDPEYNGPNILGSRMMPTAATGLLGTQELAAQQELEGLMGQYNKFMDRKPEIYNYGDIAPVKRNVVTGEYSPAMPLMIDEIMKGLLDVGQSRKTGVVNNPSSLWDVLL